MPKRASDRERARKRADGGEGDRGEKFHPSEGSRTSNQNTTAAENPCDSRDSRRRPDSGGRTRTCDPTVNSRLLYQLSYAGFFSHTGKAKKLSKPKKGVNVRRRGLPPFFSVPGGRG